MIRFLLIVAIASLTMIAWIIFNPFNTARITLQKTALLEKMQKSHDIYPSLPPDFDPLEPPAEPSASLGEPTREEKIASLRSRITELQKENIELHQVSADLKKQRNQGVGIAPSTILGIHQQISTNTAQIAALEQQRALLQ